MLSVGSNIKSIAEPLKKAPVEYIYNALKHPKPEMISRIERLRIVRQLSTEQYSKLKQQLPFFVCANFNPPYRKTENFAYTIYFIIDIDHIGDKGLSITDVKNKLTADPRTLLCFVSPGQDGIKVIMRLSEKCYDPGLYSVFYKKFIYDFSLRYGLEQVIDAKTSDVARACFMSIDPDAYYNAEAEAVNMKQFIPIEDSSQLLSLKKDIDQGFSNLAREHGNMHTSKTTPSDPSDEAMARIRMMLDMKPRRQPIQKDVFVPDTLNDIIEKLTMDIRETGLDVYEIINIQYGKKIRAKLGLKKAEVNLFYGRRGFSVVQSPKTGTDAALNKLLADVITSCLEI
jgi:hypothetical protein